MREQLQILIRELRLRADTAERHDHHFDSYDVAGIATELEAILAAHPENIVTCVYCGHAYPAGTPTHGAEVLKAHIAECPQHPMAELKRKYESLLASYSRTYGGQPEVLLPRSVEPKVDRETGLDENGKQYIFE
jgi:hypothetical protein